MTSISSITFKSTTAAQIFISFARKVDGFWMVKVDDRTFRAETENALIDILVTAQAGPAPTEQMKRDRRIAQSGRELRRTVQLHAEQVAFHAANESK